MNILKSIATLLIAGIISIGGFLGIYHASPSTQITGPEAALGAFNPSGGGTYRLQTSLGSTDTTIRLSSFKEPISGTAYTMTYLNTSIGYGTLDPQQPTRSEFISFTGITQNADGTASLTGVTRGLGRSYPYTASTTLAVTHSGQSIFILSDSPSLFNEYAVKRNAQNITGVWTFASTSAPVYDANWTVGSSSLALAYANWVYSNFVNTSEDQTINGTKTIGGTLTVPYSTASSSAASVGYANALSFAGVANANTTTKGIVQEATGAQILAGTQAGSTGADLFMNPSQFMSSGVMIPLFHGIATSTTVSTAMSTTTSMTANQTLMIFGNPEINCQGTSDVYLAVKPSNGTATSTIAHVSYSSANCGTADTRPGYIQGIYTATSTYNVKVYFAGNSTGTTNVDTSSVGTSSIMFLKFNN